MSDPLIERKQFLMGDYGMVPDMWGVPDGYIPGLGRDVPHPRLSHLYAGTLHEPGNPMCARGWNRDDGQSYSIWRNNVGHGGICKTCLRRAQKGLGGVSARSCDE